MNHAIPDRMLGDIGQPHTVRAFVTETLRLDRHGLVGLPGGKAPVLRASATIPVAGCTAD